MSDGNETSEAPITAVPHAAADAPPLEVPQAGTNGTAATPGEPALTLDEGPRRHAAGQPIAELEERIRRLEEQYKVLQDTKVIEERVVQRISQRMRRAPETQIRDAKTSLNEPGLSSMGGEAALPAFKSAGDDGPALAPALKSAPTDAPLPTPVARAAEPAPVAKHVEVPVAQVLTPPVAATAAPGPGGSAVSGWWLARFLQPLALLETLNEVRVMLRMYGDPRYHMTWLGRLVPLVFLAVFILSDLETLKPFFPWLMVPAVGWLLHKLVIIVFGFITFKIMTREVRRYQQTIPDAPGARAATSFPWS